MMAVWKAPIEDSTVEHRIIMQMLLIRKFMKSRLRNREVNSSQTSPRYFIALGTIAPISTSVASCTCMSDPSTTTPCHTQTWKSTKFAIRTNVVRERSVTRGQNVKRSMSQ